MILARTSLHLYIDTREQTPPPFPEGVTWERFKLGEADYSTPPLLNLARIERKSLSDFAGSLTHGRARFDREIERLRCFRHPCIVVEGDLGDFFEGRIQSQVHPNAIVQSIASFYARANVATFFAHDPTTAGRLICGILLRLEQEYAPAGGPNA